MFDYLEPLHSGIKYSWEDIGMLKRYGIIDSGMLERGAAKLAAYVEYQKRCPAKIVAIRG